MGCWLLRDCWRAIALPARIGENLRFFAFLAVEFGHILQFGRPDKARPSDGAPTRVATANDIPTAPFVGRPVFQLAEFIEFRRIN